jgi:hypothetical protein
MLPTILVGEPMECMVGGRFAHTGGATSMLYRRLSSGPMLAAAFRSEVRKYQNHRADLVLIKSLRQARRLQALERLALRRPSIVPPRIARSARWEPQAGCGSML